jgi:bacteriorhodopsin
LAALIVFAILGAIDFIDTYALVGRSGGPVYESNPVAARWLKNYGWDGLAIFKAATTFVVVVCVLMVRRQRPRTASILATAACLSLLAVTAYSRSLLTMQANSSGDMQNIPTQIKSD